MELAKKSNLAEIEQQARENVESLYKRLFVIGTSRSRPQYRFGKKYPADKLAKEAIRQLKKHLPVCEKKDKVNAGVYVFQGGKGDMSLIAAPVRGGEDEEVILIDGGSTVFCGSLECDIETSEENNVHCSDAPR